MSSGSGTDSENAILSLLALSHHEAQENLTERAGLDLETLGLADEDIQALLDEELAPEEEKRLQNILLFYPSLQQRFDELREQKARLQKWWSVLNNRH